MGLSLLWLPLPQDRNASLCITYPHKLAPLVGKQQVKSRFKENPKTFICLAAAKALSEDEFLLWNQCGFSGSLLDWLKAEPGSKAKQQWRLRCLEVLTESWQRFHLFQGCIRLQPWRIIRRSVSIAHCQVLQEQNENKIQNLPEV